jgi:hypothetical protein
MIQYVTVTEPNYQCVSSFQKTTIDEAKKQRHAKLPQEIAPAIGPQIPVLRFLPAGHSFLEPAGL